MKLTHNHDFVVSNQNTTIKNKGILTQKHTSIFHNQAVTPKKN